MVADDASPSGSIRRTNTWKVERTLPLPNVRYLASSSNGKLIAGVTMLCSTPFDGQYTSSLLRCFDVRSGKVLWQIDSSDGKTDAALGSFSDMCFSPDNAQLALLGSITGKLFLLDAKNGQLQRTLSIPISKVSDSGLPHALVFARWQASVCAWEERYPRLGLGLNPMNFDSLFHRNSFVPRLTPILCLLCIASFVGLNLQGQNMTYAQSQIFGLYPATSVWQGQPWSLITSTFVHLQFLHLLFNLMWLWAMGNIFEDEFGSFKWAVFFVAAAWVSSALQLLSSGDIGIGMSGVVYALIGFGWVARRKHPAFSAIMTQQNIIISVIWLVGCIVATQTGMANIGNGAHVAGLAFGVAVAGLLVAKWKPVLSGMAVVALVVAASVPLFWCPLSSDWTGIQALRAQDKHDYPTALYWYNRTVMLDPEATWALHNMLIIYNQQHDRANYEKALAQLRAKDAEDARTFEQ